MTSTEEALLALQMLVRQQQPDGDETVLTRAVPADLVREDTKVLLLYADEVLALARAEKLVRGDLRFEHLGDKVHDCLWRFVCECHLKPGRDHEAMFIKQHTRPLQQLTCFLPVEFLAVESSVTVLGLTLLPPADKRVPTVQLTLDRPVAAVAAVEVEGTNLRLMAERARYEAQSRLRLLRVSLCSWLGSRPDLLRFRLSNDYAFDERLGGWSRDDAAAYKLRLDADLIERAQKQPISRLASAAVTDIERKALLAAHWLERATVTAEPLVSVLFLFFALEALLGDKSERLKGHGLAFRQTMLSHLTSGGFSHPDQTFFLYDEVRSAAVHGEDAPNIGWDEAREFSHTVSDTLNNYVAFATEHGFARRGPLLRALDEHPERSQLVEWLTTCADPAWSRYFGDQNA